MTDPWTALFQQMMRQGQEMARAFNPALESFDPRAFEKLIPTVPADMLELAYCGLQELSAEFRVEHFTEFEQTPTGAWAVAREYPLTGPPR